jgi:hypothetical protein
MSNAVAHTNPDHLPLAPLPTENPVMSMIRQAVAAGQPLDVIRELKDMAKELAADEARRAFDRALSDAKSEIPVIRKNRKVGFEHKSGEGETNYSHEDLGEIARTIDPILGRHGLSYRYRSHQGDGRVTVTCILSHRDGHSEEIQLSAAPDGSGKKNAIQQTGSAITYLQRYTLKMALGLAAASDDDGAATVQPESITEQQALDLNDLIDTVVEEVNGDRPVFVKSFLKFMKADQIEAIAAKDYQKAVNAINASRTAR